MTPARWLWTVVGLPWAVANAYLVLATTGSTQRWGYVSMTIFFGVLLVFDLVQSQRLRRFLRRRRRAA
jgi:hypothetical protein